MADPAFVIVIKPSTIILTALALTCASASAEPDPAACERLRAEARAEAVLLYAPRLQVEGARAPDVVDTSDPAALAGGLQARASIAMPLIDALRGRAIERVAEADCVRARLARSASYALTLETRHGELEATRAELAYLVSQVDVVDSMVADIVARAAQQRATAIEVEELRGRRSSLRLRIAELRGTTAMLAELDGDVPPAPPLDHLASTIRTAELEADRRRADLRTLSAWRFDVRAGVAGGDRADWFAVLELGYSFGQPFQGGANDRALRARRAELDESDAIPRKLERLRRAMHGSVIALEAELRLLDDELATINTERTRVAEMTTDPARHLNSRLTFEHIELQSRRASIAALANARRRLARESQP